MVFTQSALMTLTSSRDLSSVDFIQMRIPLWTFTYHYPIQPLFRPFVRIWSALITFLKQTLKKKKRYLDKLDQNGFTFTVSSSGNAPGCMSSALVLLCSSSVQSGFRSQGGNLSCCCFLLLGYNEVQLPHPMPPFILLVSEFLCC